MKEQDPVSMLQEIKKDMIEALQKLDAVSRDCFSTPLVQIPNPVPTQISPDPHCVWDVSHDLKFELGLRLGPTIQT
jgi:hypothetical protein